MKTAAALGMVACGHCAALWKDVEAHDRCARCGARLHQRKPDSLNRTWALVIAACIMYFPANLLPVMTTASFPLEEQQESFSGITENVSKDGVLMLAEKLLPVGMRSELVLVLESRLERSIRLSGIGEVVRADEAAPQGKYAIAFRCDQAFSLMD